MNHLKGGTDDQITIYPHNPIRRERGPCEICEAGEVDDPQPAVVEMHDRGRNWLGVAGKDILYVCDECARQHGGDLLKRIEGVLDRGDLIG